MRLYLGTKKKRRRRNKDMIQPNDAFYFCLNAVNRKHDEGTVISYSITDVRIKV